MTRLAAGFIIPLDDWIDIGKLPIIEDEILQVVEKMPTWGDGSAARFELRGKETAVRKLRLTESIVRHGGAELSAYDYGKGAYWKPTSLVNDLPATWEFVRGLPLSQLGRVIVLTSEGEPVPLHTDHSFNSVIQEFFWIRTSRNKHLYLVRNDCEVVYVSSWAAWFDSRAPHGAPSATERTLSIRVDGVFSPSLRKFLGLATHDHMR